MKVKQSIMPFDYCMAKSSILREIVALCIDTLPLEIHLFETTCGFCLPK